MSSPRVRSTRNPSLKGLTKFIIPHGVYNQVTAQINRNLLRIYRRFSRGSKTKPQAQKEGEKVIKDAKAKITEITRRWFSKNGLEPEEPDTMNELDDFTQDKIDEWHAIVDDM